MTEKYQEIRSKLLDGSITAISIDTCIFTRAGYQLDKGIFKQLEQFKDNSFRLVFSEVTLKEVLGHIKKHADEEQTRLLTALRGVAKYWTISQETHSKVTKELLNELDPKALSELILKSFVKRCGAEIIEAKSTVDITDLLKSYFETIPPFESSGNKKAEFPDAITLLSLESWAKKEGTALLLVTSDKGCIQYCEQTQNIFAISDLRTALTLIQERDSHCGKLCESIDQLIANGKYPNLINDIETEISNDIWSIDWIPDANAAYYFEPEMQDIEVKNVSFASPNGLAELQPVDFSTDKLVAQASVNVDIKAHCDFTFSTRDWIDKDMICIGSSESVTEEQIELDVLLTFVNVNSGLPELVNIELVPARRDIDFDTVEPDYGNENPYDEDY